MEGAKMKDKKKEPGEWIIECNSTFEYIDTHQRREWYTESI